MSGKRPAPKKRLGPLFTYRRPDEVDHTKLTEREIEVIQLIADGFSTKEIAIKLFLSIHTVKSHLGKIYLKLDTRSGQAGAVAAAFRQGYIK